MSIWKGGLYTTTDEKGFYLQSDTPNRRNDATIAEVTQAYFDNDDLFSVDIWPDEDLFSALVCIHYEDNNKAIADLEEAFGVEDES